MEGGGLIELLRRSGIVSIHFVPDGRMTRIQFTRKRQTCFLSGKLSLKSLQTDSMEPAFLAGEPASKARLRGHWGGSGMKAGDVPN